MRKNNRLGNARVLGNLFFKGRVPGQLVIQYTDHCNASCPQCGMRASSPRSRSTLTTEKCEEIIKAAAARQVSALSLTGGEPLLFLDQICHLATLAGSCGIKYIRTGTNGYLFRDSGQTDFNDRMKRLADQLAATPIRNIWVSIDSADAATHERMRALPGTIKGVEKALPIFAERGLHLSANLGINRNFTGEKKNIRHFDYDFFYVGFERFYRFVEELGFSIVNVCYPMHSPDEGSENAVYAATASDRVVYFSPAEKLSLFQALSDCIPTRRGKIRIFTPRCSIHALLQQYRGKVEWTSPCRGGLDFFFVDSRNGHAYPCGYRGDEDLGEFAHLETQHVSGRGDCRRCDWECFRDPSELFSPLQALVSAPSTLLRRLKQDPQFFKLWKEDLLYYRACHFFDGRKPVDPQKMKRWSKYKSSDPSADHKELRH